MKLGTFFEKFEQFADARDAVAKMRALVFELAVMGRLSDRRTSDQKDPGWLNFLRILAEKGSSSSQHNSSPIFDIPSSWRWTTLDDLGETKPRNDAPDSAACSFVPMALISAKYGQAALFEERIWGEIKKGFTHFRDGDVVMAKITPCFENGKSALVDNLVGGIGAGTTELHVFRGISNVIDPRFVLLYLKSRGFIERGIPRMTGSAGQKRVPSDYFSNSPFPLPPPAEQKRIVAKVDELMALCDRLEAQQKERETQHAALSRAAIARFNEDPTPANLNLLFHDSYSIAPAELRRSIVALAVQGTLLPQNPADGTAELLLARIEEERENLRKKGVIRLPKNTPPLPADGLPYDIPDSWRWTRIGGIALQIDYGTSQKADADSSQVPVYRMGNINGGRLIDQDLKYVKSSIDDLPGLYLRSGDLLFNRTNSYELVGKTGIFKGQDHSATFASYLIRVRLPVSLLSGDFFNLAMNSPYFRVTQIEPEITQQCGQANFNGTKLANAVIPVPPAAEQRRIVAKVNQLMSLVDQLEAQLAVSRIKGQLLLDATVHELLHSNVDGIGVQCLERDLAADRTAIGCYTIQSLAKSPRFGRTMLMKLCYLSEAHLGLPLGWQPMRQAAGPWDSWIEDFESLGKRNDWFTVAEKGLNNGHTKIEYHAKPSLKAKAAEAITVLGDQKSEFDRLLSLFAEMNTEAAEIIATLFAAWNDLLIDRKPAADDDIIREVRENWHPKKERFSVSLLERSLGWMRRNYLVPKGRGPRTIQQFRLQLH